MEIDSSSTLDVISKELPNLESESHDSNDKPIVQENSRHRGNDFSSEYFKIVIHNLPRYVDTKALKKFLKRLDIDIRKAYVVRDHAYVCFSDDASVDRALGILQNYKWKKNNLRVKRAAAIADPVLAAQESKKAKLDDSETSKNHEEMDEISADIRLLDAVVPLHKLSYDDQLALKERESQELLKKISRNIMTECAGGQAVLPECGYFGDLLPILPSPVINGYRNKCEFSIGYDGDHRPTVGFRLTRYKAGSTEIVSPEQCPNLPEMTKRIVSSFQQFIVESGLSPYDVSRKTGFWTMLTVRQFTMDAMVIVTVYPRELTKDNLEMVKKSLIKFFSTNTFENGFHITSLYFQELTQSSDAAVYEHLFGAPYVYENLLGLRFRISPGAFFQVNSVACEVLYKRILNVSKPDAETMVVDLCCGTGTIGIVLAAKAGQVFGVESCVEAVEDAHINAKNNERTNCEFICAKVENIIDDLRRRMIDSQYKRMVGILDPPRSGLAGKVISAVRQLAAMKMIVYVSCNPNAATKNFVDLTRRSSNRYPGEPFKMKSVQPVDLFPHTKHCEWIVVFER